RNRHEDVPANQEGKERRGTRVGVERLDAVGLEAVEERRALEERANLLRLAVEDLLGEVLENVRFRLSEDLAEVTRRDAAPLGYLADQLKRRDPPLRSLAVLLELVASDLEA